MLLKVYMKRIIKALLVILCFQFLISACKKDRPNVRQNPVTIKASFTADQRVIAVGEVVNFSDSTTGFPLTWKWYFEGGTPATSTVQHPKNIKYSALGEYDVTLVVTNAYGKDSLVRKGYIKVARELIAPTVTTAAPYDIDTSSAKGGGEVTEIGSSDLIEIGVCWAKTERPTIDNSKVVTGRKELGEFLVNMEDLEDNTTYYYRAFARNNDEVGYGQQYSFTTLEVDTCDFVSDRFTDPRDGNVYRFIEIAGKIWMGDNLKYTSSGSWCYDDMAANCGEYGRLYTINAAKTACPAGWRLPSNQEWEELIAAVGTNPGVKMKRKNVWKPAPATNDYCFSAMAGGYKNLETNRYGTVGFFGYWWTSSKNAENLNIVKYISYDNSQVISLAYDDEMAFSVRCIKN